MNGPTADASDQSQPPSTVGPSHGASADIGGSSGETADCSHGESSHTSIQLILAADLWSEPTEERTPEREASTTVDSTAGGALPPDDARGGPSRVGRFELRRWIGGGGEGEVFLAYDPRLERCVALKIPRRERLHDPEVRRRYLSEARTAAALSHPHIVAVHEADEAGPLCFIATDYCERGSLASWIAERADPVPPRLSARIVAPIADAISYAHEREILHLDLKPANVLLSPAPLGEDGLDFLPRVCDFGIARRLNLGDEACPDGVIGTAAYMAPEQVVGRSAEIGRAADIYGLGTILYCLLTGHPPFRGSSRDETFTLVRTIEPDPPRLSRPEIPRDLEAICLKCLSKHPADRYASAAELARDLRRFLAGEPILGRRVGPLGRAARAASRHTGMTVAALIGLVGIGGAAVLREQARRDREASWVDHVIAAPADEIPGLLEPLRAASPTAVGRLKAIEQSASASSGQRGRAAWLRLLRAPREFDADPADLLQADPETLRAGSSVLKHQGLVKDRPDVLDRLAEIQAEAVYEPRTRLAAAGVLAQVAPDRPIRFGNWLHPELAELSSEETSAWARLLSPASPSLEPVLTAILEEAKPTPAGLAAARLLAALLAGRVDALVDRIAATHPRLAAPLAKALADPAARNAAQPRLNAMLHDRLGPRPVSDTRSRRRASAAVALLILGRPDDVWPTLLDNDDPDVRSWLIPAFAASGIPPSWLLAKIVAGDAASPGPARQALVLALSFYQADALPKAKRALLTEILLEVYRTDPDPGVHSAIGWLLAAQWNGETLVRAIDDELRSPEPISGRRWYVTPGGQVLAVIPGPSRFEAMRETSSDAVVTIPRSFAIATHKVTVNQLLELLPDHRIDPTESPDGACPVTTADYLTAVRYCLLLSQKERIPEDQWCYPATVLTRDEPPQPFPDFLERTGYRLPTEDEHEFAVRASITNFLRYFGRSPEHTASFEWTAETSGSRTHPVGLRMPNAFGLFDCLGSTREWCTFDDPFADPRHQILRGVPFQTRDLWLCSALRTTAWTVYHLISGTGFRVARTLPNLNLELSPAPVTEPSTADRPDP